MVDPNTSIDERRRQREQTRDYDPQEWLRIADIENVLNTVTQALAMCANAQQHLASQQAMAADQLRNATQKLEQISGVGFGQQYRQGQRNVG